AFADAGPVRRRQVGRRHVPLPVRGEGWAGANFAHDFDGTTHPLYSFLTTSRAAMRLPEGSLRTRQAGSRVEVAAAPSAAAAYRLNHAHTCHFHVTHFPFQGRGFWPCVRFAFVCER